MRFKIVLYNIIKREKLLINYYFVERMIQIIFFRTLLCNCLVSLEIGFLYIVIRQKLSEIHAFHSIHIYIQFSTVEQLVAFKCNVSITDL